MDEEKNNILYRPKLEPELNYKSDGTFQDAIEAEQTEEKTVNNTPQKLIEDYKEIVELIDLLPDGLHFLADSIEKLIERLEIIYPDGVIEEEEAEFSESEVEEPDFTTNTAEQEENELDPDLPSLVPDAPLFDITLETPKTLVEIIQSHYDSDTIDLNENYLQSLQTAMQRYFQSMLMTMSDVGLDSITNLTRDFDGESVSVPADQGLEHLRDYVVRSQTEREQKTLLFQKTHSVDDTLIHLRSWHAAEQARERYYKESYKDSENYTQSQSNALLRESRTKYDTAYENSMYNLYKYLNSSVILTNDTLNMTVKEAQAKAMLLKAGVNIFETADTVSSS